jgi:hypothetical protein
MEYQAQNQKNESSPDADVAAAEAHASKPATTFAAAIFNIVTDAAWLPFHTAGKSNRRSTLR